MFPWEGARFDIKVNALASAAFARLLSVFTPDGNAKLRGRAPTPKSLRMQSNT
jgi:hypothetical protein